MLTNDLIITRRLRLGKNAIVEAAHPDGVISTVNLLETVSVLDDRFIPIKEHAAIRAGTSTYDCTAGIQSCINYVQSLKHRPTILVPVGKYKITSTITITAECMSLVGLGEVCFGRGDDSSDTTRGATLRYYGTGTALQIGVAPGVNGTHIEQTRIQNLRIEVDNNTYRAMHVWHSTGGFFQNIAIFGNKGAGNIGLHVQAGTHNIYERIFINGLGQTPGADSTEYVEAGLRGDLGYSNDLATTTVFRRCYFTYSYYATYLLYVYDFEDCVFESSYRGVQALGGVFEGQFRRCWWEANVNLDVYFDASRAQIIGGRINSYARQTYFSSGGGLEKLVLRDVKFSTTHASPILFATSASLVVAGGTVLIDGCEFAANTILGASGVTGHYPVASVVNQTPTIYRFLITAVAANTTYSPVPTDSGIAGGQYIMAAPGNIVGINIYYTGTISAGSFDIATKINGSNVTDLSYPAQPAFTTEPLFRGGDILKNEVARSDVMTFYLHTDASFAATGGDFVIEVLIAHGNSGVA